MFFGYRGSMLHIDLNKKQINKEVLDHEVLREWLGGTGLGVKFVYEKVDSSTAWDDPDNCFVLASGPLGGTAVKGCGNYCVVTKGPMTGGMATTQAGGYLGAFLKFCGYDGLLIEGSSPEWVYLYIDDDKVEIRPASHLLGLDTVQTQETLHRELSMSPRQLSICCIGPAGENLVRFACLVGDYGHVAAHNGVGAVLGSKKVKAIAVKRGKKKVEVFDKDALRDLATQMNDAAKSSPSGSDCFNWGTNAGHIPLHATGALPVKNLTTSIFPEHVDFSGKALRAKFEYKKRPCWGCNWNHCGVIKITSGPFQGFETEEPEYEAMAAMGPLIGITDPAKSLVLADYVDRLGMDVNETGWLMGWVMECFEKGYMTAEAIDGLEMKWGSFENTKQLLKKVAHREGVGAFLAEGVMRAAKEIGGQALECAVFTEKGNSPRGHDHRAVWTEYLDTCVSSTGTIETTGGSINVTQHNREPLSDPFSWEQVAEQNAALSGRRVFTDCLGVCRICAAEDINLTVLALKAATGDDFTVEKAMWIGKRIVNLMRVFNIQNGITAEKDKPSPRYASVVVDGPAQGRSIGKVFQQMKERYYELMGWEKKTGKPLPETLEKYGLSEIVSDL
jgi:aldehyde:ferredoxin oxidoreductase